MSEPVASPRIDPPRRFPGRGGPILCALDRSGAGQAVAFAGARLAVMTGAPLVLLHIAQERNRRPWHALERVLRADRRPIGHAVGWQMLEQRAARLPIAASLDVRSGDPSDEILVAAEHADAALVLLGMRPPGLSHPLRRSVSREVMESARCPVVVVPERANVTMRGPVVCGLDDSSASVRAAEFGAQLAAVLGEEVILVSVAAVTAAPVPVAPAAMPVVEPVEQVNVREDALRREASVVADRTSGIAPTRVMADRGDPAGRLDTAADELAAAIVAVGNQRRSRLASVLAPTVGSALAGRSSRPVLLVP